MKAEDTVMTKERIAAIMMVSEEYGYEKGIDIAREQAEISFKAGIKEVLDAIHYEPYSNAFYVQPNEWQSKLKEWGIKGKEG